MGYTFLPLPAGAGTDPTYPCTLSSTTTTGYSGCMVVPTAVTVAGHCHSCVKNAAEPIYPMSLRKGFCLQYVVSSFWSVNNIEIGCVYCECSNWINLIFYQINKLILNLQVNMIIFFWKYYKSRTYKSSLPNWNLILSNIYFNFTLNTCFSVCMFTCSKIDLEFISTKCQKHKFLYAR